MRVQAKAARSLLRLAVSPGRAVAPGRRLGRSRAARLLGLALASAVLWATGAMTQAAAATLRARYSLTYVGFRVGELAIANTVERSVYDTTLDARLTGLATVASSYRHVSMKAHGILRGTTAVPTSFSVTQTGQDESRKLRISLAGGSATSIEIDPPIEDADQRVPIIDEHKRNVVDPASALIVTLPAGEDGIGPRVCDRTLRIFGGFFRSDIELSYVRTEEFRAKGYSGPVTVCSARYVPIAGHRKDSAMARFMPNDRGIEVRLAPVQGASLVMLV